MTTVRFFPILICMTVVAGICVQGLAQVQVRVTPKGQIECINPSSAVFVGEGAGAADGILNTRNVFIGKKAGFTNTTGYDNVAVGFESATLNTTGHNLTAIGTEALRSNTEGYFNVAIGNQALLNCTTGYENTAIGTLALQANTTGSFNVAIGPFALQNPQIGEANIAIGSGTMQSNLSGTHNLGIGFQAMQMINNGWENIALGTFALRSITSATRNVAIGVETLRSNVVGDDIVAVGHQAGFGDYQESNRNVYIGKNAGGNGTINSVIKSNNVMVGFESGHLATGSGNVFVGYQTGRSSTLSNRLYIDNSSTASPLVFGNFATDELEINGKLILDNANGADQLVWDQNQTRLKEGLDLFTTERATLRFLLDTDNNNSGSGGQSRVQFFTNVDTSGSLTPPLSFNLDGGDSWINSGDVGLGLTNPNYKLDVAGTINAASGLAGPQTALRAQGAEAVWFDGTQFSWGFGGSWNRFADSVRIGTNVAPSHILQVDGIARSTQSTWATTSDARVKENIRPIESALATIQRFRPVTFAWKEFYKAAHPEVKDENYGFISQEVETIIPSMVTQVKEILGDTIIEDFRVLNTDALVPLLVKAVQEQQILIDAMRHELDQYRDLLYRQSSTHNESVSVRERRTKIQKP